MIIKKILKTNDLNDSFNGNLFINFSINLYNSRGSEFLCHILPSLGLLSIKFR